MSAPLQDKLLAALRKANNFLVYPGEVCAVLGRPALTDSDLALINGLIDGKVAVLEMQGGVDGPLTLRLL